MRNKKVPNSFLLSTLLAGSALIIAGCHNSGPAATPEVALPVIEQSCHTAEILADGSIQIPATRSLSTSEQKACLSFLLIIRPAFVWSKQEKKC